MSYSIQQTTDGGYIVAGSSRPFGAWLLDFWILKLSSAGDIEWQRTYGGDDNEGAHSIQQTSDGGYIVAGYTDFMSFQESNFCVLKLSSTGNIEWQYAYGMRSFSKATSIQQTSDGGYIVAGYATFMGASFDFWFLKLSSNGGPEWLRIYDPSPAGFDMACSTQQTSDGGYIVAGHTGSFSGVGTDFWLFKLSSAGDIEWQRTYGGDDKEGVYSIQQTGDGGYIVAGSTRSFGAGEEDFLILKLSSNGDIEWQRTYGGSGYDEATSIQQTPDGGYIVAGSTRSFGAGEEDFLILKLSSNGDIVPSCELIGSLDAAVSDTSIIPQDTYITLEHTNRTPTFPNFTPKDTDAIVNVVCGEPVDDTEDSEENKDGCFIATAAYGSLLHPHVKILRDFRDKYLMPSKLGRALVDIYYKYSPFAANLIARHKVLKIAARINLLPLVVFSYSMLHFGPIITTVIFVSIFALPIFLIFLFRRRFRQTRA